jgi:hypothetical protein
VRRRDLANADDARVNAGASTSVERRRATKCFARRRLRAIDARACVAERASRREARRLRSGAPMKFSYLRALSVTPFVLAIAACSSAPGEEGTGTSEEDITGGTIVSRAMQWVDARLHYCQARHEARDYDSACWGWEGSAHLCHRESNVAWNPYRSDCSGFVSWAWGLPAVGSGGYVTSEFAPYGRSFSHTINGSDLRPGDALNKTPDGHIILFKHWVTAGRSAVFMEEPGCSSSTPYAHEFTSSVSIHGDEVYVASHGETFYAIRYDRYSAGGGGGGGGGSAPDACNKPAGFCTETLQCENGHWIIRQDDPHACTTVENVNEPCNVGGGYCTETLQCENGHWVPRVDDPARCTSGPGSAR